MTPSTASQLTSAARVADGLVYVVGLAGVIAGGLLLRRGDMGFAVVAWSLTFAGGAGLRLAAGLARGLAEVLGRQARMDDAMSDLRADRVAEQRREQGRPWG